jgi:imidazolonepropionase-like amidohydrolase
VRIDTDLLIPGRGDPVADGAVVVTNGIISYAGPAADAPGEPGQRVPALMPGMWDCHAHFTGMSVLSLVYDARTSLATKAARATDDARNALMAGVTSVREPGGLGLDLRPAVDEGRIVAPHIYSAGRILTTTGGHADVHGFPIDSDPRQRRQPSLSGRCEK